MEGSFLPKCPTFGRSCCDQEKQPLDNGGKGWRFAPGREARGGADGLAQRTQREGSRAAARTAHGESRACHYQARWILRKLVGNAADSHRSTGRTRRYKHAEVA